MIDTLNWDAILHLFKFLSLKDLFTLRCVNQETKTLVEEYLQHITSVNLNRNNMNNVDLGFEVLAYNTRNLQSLTLTSCDWLQNKPLSRILNNNPKIHTLCLNNTNNITAAALQPLLISGQGKYLRVLKLSKCYFFTSGAFETLVFHHSLLEELDLSYSNILSERRVILAIHKFRKLKILNLAHVRAVGDRAVCAIAKFSVELKHLNLTGCEEVTDVGIRALALRPTGLESLMVRGCSKVTDLGLAPLRAKGPIHIDLPRGSRDIPHRPFQQLFLQV